MTRSNIAATGATGALQRAVRARFLAEGSPYGCAETALLVLQGQFGLGDSSDGAAALALNGGVAYSGGTCGAITGAAMALGRLAERRAATRGEAKRIARGLTAGTIDEFQVAFGATDCRTLTGMDLRAPGGHDAFIAAGAWRVECLRRLELVVERLAPLVDSTSWDEAVAGLGAGAGSTGAASADAPAHRPTDRPTD